MQHTVCCIRKSLSWVKCSILRNKNYSTILAVKCVCQSTLNLTRGRLVIQNYSKTGNILSVEEVNQMEPVIFPCHSKKKIIIGAKYENEQNLIPFSDKGKEMIYHVMKCTYRVLKEILRRGMILPILAVFVQNLLQKLSFILMSKI